jgi:hypothetical protein
MDGTDLSIAYGSAYQDNGYSSYSNKPKQYEQDFDRDDQHKGRTIDLPLPKMSSVPVENPAYKVPQDIYANQGNDQIEEKKKPRYAESAEHPSFWDRIGSKKMEVLKVFLLALVIVLGISIDHLSKHYLDKYISTAFLTESQEFLIRLSYPLIIILLIWVMKAM